MTDEGVDRFSLGYALWEAGGKRGGWQKNVGVELWGWWEGGGGLGGRGLLD